MLLSDVGIFEWARTVLGVQVLHVAGVARRDQQVPDVITSRNTGDHDQSDADRPA